MTSALDASILIFLQILKKSHRVSQCWKNRFFQLSYTEEIFLCEVSQSIDLCYTVTQISKYLIGNPRKANKISFFQSFYLKSPQNKTNLRVWCSKKEEPMMSTIYFMGVSPAYTTFGEVFAYLKEQEIIFLVFWQSLQNTRKSNNHIGNWTHWHQILFSSQNGNKTSGLCEKKHALLYALCA